jgi:hypothetical protein
MEKHFVTFCSPGTFVSETSEAPIDSWDIPTALTLARGIKERHGATPYGFFFKTRSRREDELDSKVTATSNMYYLGGKVETLEEVEARNLPDEKILLWNMKNNGIKKIITNTNSWKFTAALQDNDVVLQWEK